MSFRKDWVALIAFCLFTSGCKYPSRLLPATVPPIRLAQEQTVTSGKRAMIVPAGVYDAVYEGKDGVYYNAPRSIERTKYKPPLLVPSGPSVFLHGGVFIPKPEAKDQRHGIWTYSQRVIPLLGKLVETRPLEMIRLHERITYVRVGGLLCLSRDGYSHRDVIDSAAPPSDRLWWRGARGGGTPSVQP